MKDEANIVQRYADSDVGERIEMPRARKEINEEALKNLVHSGQKKFVRYDEGKVLYSMGLHSFQEIAKEAKATYKVDKIVLVNTEILDKYMETFREF